MDGEARTKGLDLGLYLQGIVHGREFPRHPVRVAALFKQWLDAHPGVFAKVVFAIPGGPNLDAFQDAFEHREEAVPADVDEPEDDDEDWRDGLDLPEGITLR